MPDEKRHAFPALTITIALAAVVPVTEYFEQAHVYGCRPDVVPECAIRDYTGHPENNQDGPSTPTPISVAVGSSTSTSAGMAAPFTYPNR